MQYSRRGVSSATAYLAQEESSSSASASYLLRSRTSAELHVRDPDATLRGDDEGDEPSQAVEAADTSSLTSTDSDVATNDAAGADEPASSTQAVQRAGSRRRA